MRRCSFLAVLLALAAPAAAREIHVDNVLGDDRASGEHAQPQVEKIGPVQTIAKALRLAQQGDRIVLAKNEPPYRESISLMGSRHSGDGNQPFTIVGNGSILDGSASIPSEAWKHYEGAVFRFRPPQMAYQQFFLNDRPAVRVVGSSMSGSPPKLNALEWCLHAGAIYFCVEPAKLPADYRLSCANYQTGITLYQVDRVAIQDLTVQGFQYDGINLSNSARRVRIERVTCRGNGHSGVSVGGASELSIDTCLVGNNGAAQLLTLPYSRTHLHNSSLLFNTAAGWVDRGGTVYVGDKQIHGGLEQLRPEAVEPAGSGAKK